MSHVLYTLVVQEEYLDATLLHQYIVDTGAHPEEDVFPEDMLRELAADYALQTAEGSAIAMKEGEMPWNLFMENCPPELLAKHGFNLIDEDICAFANMNTSANISKVMYSVVDAYESLIDQDELQGLFDRQSNALKAADTKSLDNDALKRDMLDAGYTEEQAGQVVGVLTGTLDPLSIESVVEQLKRNHGCSSWDIQDGNIASDFLEEVALNCIMEGFGLEEARTERAAAVTDNPDIRYINTGDLYNFTLLKYEDHWYATSLSDAVEAIEGLNPMAGKLNLPAPTLDPLSENPSNPSMKLGG